MSPQKIILEVPPAPSPSEIVPTFVLQEVNFIQNVSAEKQNFWIEYGQKADLF